MTAIPPVTAVIIPTDWNPSTFERWRAEHGLASARVYRADQLDDVERAIRSGRVRRVSLPEFAPLLEATWEQEIDLAYWLASGVQVELPEPDGATLVRLLGRLESTWRAWNRRRRRRNAGFACLLSLLAVALAAGWTWLAQAEWPVCG